MRHIARLALLSAFVLSGCSSVERAPSALPFDARLCPSETRRAAPVLDLTKNEEELLEPTGPGLWIGGASFSPDLIDVARQSFNSYNNTPVVDIRFSPAGQNRFRCVQEGRVGKMIEMSYDGKFLSRPILNEIITDNNVQISGNFTVEDAQKLASQIKRGRP